ncbi:hypothetical protein CH64_2041 [Yersinia rohdei]|uniref:Uncharacterized protein n=1 Tax=Yersinia rohdei TaxID=29485 RepID=A0ABM5S9R7_YERRO|nr:hypothetical protein [Yersinia rohdei]AJJ09984.1 hypothetical protein CH64_2041 [Yersinia rohdei]EEQ03062.1 hypothetical protein yrohd0001_16790 [Yersinia rohdei ATCC 43380]
MFIAIISQDVGVFVAINTQPIHKARPVAPKFAPGRRVTQSLIKSLLSVCVYKTATIICSQAHFYLLADIYQLMIPAILKSGSLR